MEKTWASGAIELLRHADSHIHLQTAFDKRIAYISVDNSVETIIRTFLSLPQSKSGVRIPYRELEEAENSFPKLLALLFRNVRNRFVGLDETDIEHYHRIRNKLYHDGTGLSVDEQYLLAYRRIAAILLQNLFHIPMEEPQSAPTLERLILLWDQVASFVNQRMIENNVDTGHTYKWEMAMQANILSMADIQDYVELQMIRNREVHSERFDQKKIDYAIHLAENLLGKLR